MKRKTLSDQLRARILNCGESRYSLWKKTGIDQATLGRFISDFIESRSDLKPGTKSNLEQARDWMVDFFGADKSLRDITPGAADQWALWMLEKGLGQETAKRHAGRAKQLFKVALRR